MKFPSLIPKLSPRACLPCNGFALDVSARGYYYAGLPSSVRSRSGQRCSLCRAVDLRVLRPTRRIHIRRRGRVLHNSPPPASVRSAAAPPVTAHGTSGRVRRGARGLGLTPAPCAVAPVVFAAIRAAMRRRRIRLPAFRRVSPRIRRTASLHVAQFGTRPLVPCLTFRKARFSSKPLRSPTSRQLTYFARDTSAPRIAPPL